MMLVAQKERKIKAELLKQYAVSLKVVCNGEIEMECNSENTSDAECPFGR